MKTKDKKTVLITGATGDIGRAIAAEFARHGWNLVCHSTSDKKARELKQEMSKLQVSCVTLRADFTKEREVQALVKSLKSLRIDCLVNNAGSILRNKHFSSLSLRDIQEIFMINVVVPMLITAKVFVGMKERGFGRIINISSIAAKYGGSSQSLPYGCSKMAIEGLTKTLGREGAPYNILCNTIRPGVINTQFHQKFPKNLRKRIKMIPLKRAGTVDDIAQTVYFLAGLQNRFITRTTVTVAGGE